MFTLLSKDQSVKGEITSRVRYVPRGAPGLRRLNYAIHLGAMHAVSNLFIGPGEDFFFDDKAVHTEATVGPKTGYNTNHAVNVLLMTWKKKKHIYTNTRTSHSVYQEEIQGVLGCVCAS